MSSTDTVTIRQDRTKPFNPSDLQWLISADFAPSANAGTDQTVAVGSSVLLDGSGSMDPEGRPVIVSWNFAERPPGSTASFAAANALTTAFGADVPGIFQLRLTVTDDSGATAEDEVTITVEPPLDVAITSPRSGDLINTPNVTVAGTVDSRAMEITVNGKRAALSGTSYSVQIPLQEGGNIISAVARTDNGLVTTASVSVLRDTVPPAVAIEFPHNGEIVATETVAIAGLVNDIVAGTINDENCTVEVVGPSGSRTAQVGNRAFSIPDFAVVDGENLITATPKDSAGNVGEPVQIRITRVEAVGTRITPLDGDGQAGVVKTELPQPLSVEIRDENGAPLQNQTVDFRVVRNDGLLHTDTQPNGSNVLTLETDAAGIAQAKWVLGSRVGAGNNRGRSLRSRRCCACRLHGLRYSRVL